MLGLTGFDVVVAATGADEGYGVDIGDFTPACGVVDGAVEVGCSLGRVEDECELFAALGALVEGDVFGGAVVVGHGEGHEQGRVGVERTGIEGVAIAAFPVAL